MLFYVNVFIGIVLCDRYTKQARYQPSGDSNPVVAASQNNSFSGNAAGYGANNYGAPNSNISGGGPSSQRYGGGGGSIPVAAGGFGAAPLGPIGGGSVASGSNFGYGGDSSNAAGGLGPSTQYTRAQNDPSKLQQSRFSRLAQFGMANAGQPPTDQSSLGGLNTGASNVLGGNYGRHKF